MPANDWYDPTFVSESASSSTDPDKGLSASVTLPGFSGGLAGGLYVISLSTSDGTGQDFTTPTGWTAVFLGNTNNSSILIGTAGGGVAAQQIYVKPYADDDIGTTVTIPMANAAYWVMTATLLGGIDSSVGFGIEVKDFSVTATDGTYTSPSVLTAQPIALGLTFWSLCADTWHFRPPPVFLQPAEELAGDPDWDTNTPGLGLVQAGPARGQNNINSLGWTMRPLIWYWKYDSFSSNPPDLNNPNGAYPITVRLDDAASRGPESIVVSSMFFYTLPVYGPRIRAPRALNIGRIRMGGS